MNGIVSFRLCTLTDEELIKEVDRLTDSMYNRNNMTRNDGVPMRHIPARPNEDYDLLVGELLVRFNNLINPKSEHVTTKDLQEIDRANDEKEPTISIPVYTLKCDRCGKTYKSNMKFPKCKICPTCYI